MKTIELVRPMVPNNKERIFDMMEPLVRLEKIDAAEYERIVGEWAYSYLKESKDYYDVVLMGYYLTKELLREDKNLTAIVGMNDMIAFGIMDAVLESKLRIPADISVVGCDNTVYSSFRSISLTTIDHYVPLKGRDACDIILRKIQSLRESQDGNEPLSTYHVEYEPKLIVRRSTSYARTEKLKNK